MKLLALALFGMISGCVLLSPFPARAQVPGAERWHVSVPGQIEASPAVASDGTIYVGSHTTSEAYLSSISASGSTNWSKGVGSSITSPTIGPGGTIYFGTDDGQLTAKSPAGDLLWTLLVPSGSLVSSPAVGADGVLYFTAQAPPQSHPSVVLFSLRPDSTTNFVLVLGQVSRNAFGSVQRAAPSIGPDGTIYVATVDEHIYAITPRGTTNWSANLTSPTYASPSIDANGSVYIGTDSGKVFAFDHYGSQKWVFAAGRFVESSVALGRQGEIYFGSGDGFTYALGSDGTKLWSLPTGGISASPLVTDDGGLILASYSGLTTFCLDASGTNRWTFTNPAPVYASVAIGADGTIYTAAGSRLYALAGTNTLLSASWPMFRHDAKHTARATQCGLQSPVLLPDGQTAINLTLEPGRSYRVEGSTNLFDWEQLTNFVANGPTNQFIDQASPNLPKNFYRLSVAP